MQEPKLTVIVPAYNVADWLPRCLTSLIQQSYKNLEIIVINDGSTDATKEVLDTFAKKDKRIKAIHQKNKGLISVRETGILRAKGEYVGFVDGDDSVLPDMYERLINNAIKYEADIAHCGMMYYLEDGRRIPMHGTNELVVYDKYEGLKALLRGEKIEPSLCNKIYRKELLMDSCLDPNILNNEDLLRNYVLFLRADKSIFEDFCGYIYWRRDGSMSNHRDHVEMCKNILKARKKILDIANEQAKQDAYYCYLATVVYCYNMMIKWKNDNNREFKKYCRQVLRDYVYFLSVLNKRQNLQALTIIYMPCIYDVIYKVYLRRRKCR